ncbi:MAG: hypothetical protein FJ220_05910, partial [Kiritimatiellaceae bacterium]|nr:hypothetical protein [Kiritimatiellaceae bacterium]
MLLCLRCGAQEHTFSVMTYNVKRYAVIDRDNDGDVDDPKPETERLAIRDLLLKERPDILTVQEMGGPQIFTRFCDELRLAGLDYPYVELLDRGRFEMNLAILSRFPLASVIHHTNEWYSIGDAKVPVARGFLDVDIQVTPTFRVRLVAAHLKSKVYSSLGQTEMRRNEARLLNKIVR